MELQPVGQQSDVGTLREERLQTLAIGRFRQHLSLPVLWCTEQTRDFVSCRYRFSEGELANFVRPTQSIRQGSGQSKPWLMVGRCPHLDSGHLTPPTVDRARERSIQTPARSTKNACLLCSCIRVPGAQGLKWILHLPACLPPFCFLYILASSSIDKS